MACALLLLLGTGCTQEPPPSDKAALAPLPPGDALPPRVDAMLYGSAQTCRGDDCPGGVCYYGACVGLLVVDQRWMQVEITERIVAAVAAREGLRPRVIAHLVRQLDQPKADLAIRARTLLPLEGLSAKEALLRALGDPDERLQGAAALALTRLGAAEGLPMVRALTEHEELGIAAEALRALGKSKLDGALVPLLRNLNANLDAVLLRAALDGLRALGDLRAARPLHEWLAQAPEYLHHEILVTLRGLTGASLGNDVEGWGRWIETHDAPMAPEYTLRVQTAEDELGLPAP
jgi:hypothetical protein